MILAEGARRYFFHRHVTASIDLLYLDCQTKRAHWSLCYPFRLHNKFDPHLLLTCFASSTQRCDMQYSSWYMNKTLLGLTWPSSKPRSARQPSTARRSSTGLRSELRPFRRLST